MKGKAPAFQVYPADDLAEWFFLSNDEVGVFSRLRHMIWINGDVSMEEFNATIGINLGTESKMKVLEKFDVDGEKISHADLKLQKKSHEAFRKMQAEKSRKYWKGKRKTQHPVDIPEDVPRDGPLDNQRVISSISSLHSESSTKNQNEEKSDHDKKKDVEKMQIKEFTKRNPEAAHIDHSGSDAGQQTNGDSPPDKPEINISVDDRPEGVLKFLENIKAPKRAAPIVGTWGEDDPAPHI